MRQRRTSSTTSFGCGTAPDKVAGAPDGVAADGGDVVDHGAQGGQVGVEVGDDGDSHARSLTTASCPSGTPR